MVRVVADPDYTRGEYAILLRSDLKGHGLGWRLMQHLIAYARSEKLAELRADGNGRRTLADQFRQQRRHGRDRTPVSPG